MLSARDRAMVELVGRFRQLTASQLGVALFAGQASKTPLDRTLKRLVERRYLARLARPVGGDGGGSAQYVYQLGRAGWRLLGTRGKYWPFRAVNLHALAVADCFTSLAAADRAGECALLRFDPEPACHVAVGAVTLTPDAYVEVGYRHRGVKLSVWLEVDRGTEHRETIKEKCVRYWRAYQQWESEVFPSVVFVVPDEQRARQIEQIIAGGPAEAQAIFDTGLFSTFTEVIRGIADRSP
ncbi:MAG TPA: replication-relaxation family protein [Pseudonocardiaceae bacterium]|jgi:hypothetical protein|nr:replication-relaxation family protein [Pseudonocardiaceae bacterium]